MDWAAAEWVAPSVPACLIVHPHFLALADSIGPLAELPVVVVQEASVRFRDKSAIGREVSRVAGIGCQDRLAAVQAMAQVPRHCQARLEIAPDSVPLVAVRCAPDRVATDQEASIHCQVRSATGLELQIGPVEELVASTRYRVKSGTDPELEIDPVLGEEERQRFPAKSVVYQVGEVPVGLHSAVDPVVRTSFHRGRTVTAQVVVQQRYQVRSAIVRVPFQVVVIAHRGVMGTGLAISFLPAKSAIVPEVTDRRGMGIALVISPIAPEELAAVPALVTAA